MKEIEETKKYFFKFFEEFSGFALKRNAIDMALGIVIGLAFSKVVTSLVSDIIMPPIGVILAGVNFKDLKFILKQAILNSKGKVVRPAVTINYGNFLQSLIDFAIVAFAAFIIIKIISKLIRKNEPNQVDWTQYIKK